MLRDLQKMASKCFTKKFSIIERHTSSRQLLYLLQRRQMGTENDLLKTGSKWAALATGKTCPSPQLLQRLSLDGGENRTLGNRLPPVA